MGWSGRLAKQATDMDNRQIDWPTDRTSTD
jgi:hypothetical protein